MDMLRREAKSYTQLVEKCMPTVREERTLRRNTLDLGEGIMGRSTGHMLSLEMRYGVSFFRMSCVYAVR